MQFSDKKGFINDMIQKMDEFFSIPRAQLCHDKLTQLLEQSKKNKGCVVKIHLENFKYFNDTFGYQFGELFLKEILKFLSSVAYADVYRIAGVEFILILDGFSRSDASKAVDAIAGRFEGSWHINNIDCMCTMNMGLIYYPGHAGSSYELLDCLSHAIRESSQIGQNQVVTFDEKFLKKVYQKNSIARLIPKALENDLLEIRYRPCYNVERGRFTRADCYIRLYTEEFGIIQANEFIPIAEESGQIYAVSQYAIAKVCKIISQLIEEKIDFETISVPVSSMQFLQERFVGDVLSAIKEAGIPANKLAFEVSENISLNSFASTQMRMGKLSDAGIEIILTEFGTAYSNIYNTINMPVDVVKLERMLIWQLDNDNRSTHLIEGLIYIAKNLGLKVIAEGVESVNQSEMLKKFGCNYEQGFYYSPTLSAQELIKVIKDMK